MQKVKINSREQLLRLIMKGRRRRNTSLLSLRVEEMRILVKCGGLFIEDLVPSIAFLLLDILLNFITVTKNPFFWVVL